MIMPVLKLVRIPTKGVPWYKRALGIFKRREWELAGKWYFRFPPTAGVAGTLILPEGFRFDAASVPRLFWWIPGFSPVGVLMIPALIHDYAYRRGYLPVRLYRGDIISFGWGYKRTFWDNLFLKMSLYVNGVVLIDYIAWLGIRLGGWNAWRKCRRAT